MKKVKEEMIGHRTTTETLGVIIIRADHVTLLEHEGRYELLTTEEAETAALIPIEKQNKKQLQAMAKDLKGYKSTLNKDELIELINEPKS